MAGGPPRMVGHAHARKVLQSARKKEKKAFVQVFVYFILIIKFHTWYAMSMQAKSRFSSINLLSSCHCSRVGSTPGGKEGGERGRPGSHCGSHAPASTCILEAQLDVLGTEPKQAGQTWLAGPQGSDCRVVCQPASAKCVGARARARAPPHPPLPPPPTHHHHPSTHTHHTQTGHAHGCAHATSRRTGGVVRAGVEKHHAAGGRAAERVAHALKVQAPGLLVVVGVAAQQGRRRASRMWGWLRSRAEEGEGV